MSGHGRMARASGVDTLFDNPVRLTLGPRQLPGDALAAAPRTALHHPHLADP